MSQITASRQLSAVVFVCALCTVTTSPLFLGIDGGTESIRAALFDQKGSLVAMHSKEYKTSFPKAGWAEQNPQEWWDAMGDAVKGVIAKADNPEVAGMCVDTTCCTVVALGAGGAPLAPAILWMDQRAAQQATDILQKAKGDPALSVHCGGQGPVSAEFMLPKALWLKTNKPEVWAQASTICEYQDYVNLQLTGRICASACNAAARWNCDGEEATVDKSGTGGRPLGVLDKVGMRDLADKWPHDVLPMGALVGEVTKEAAAHLGVKPGLRVVQGGPDAFVGLVGLGCIKQGELGLITGSSHLHIIVSKEPKTAPGIWGAYRGAPLPGLCFAEGGQSSTGSILRWLRGLFEGDADLKGGDGLSYAELDALAARVPVGCEGLVALETFQGSRTPTTDPLARGALLGLSLRHTKGHIWRAMMEGVCLGTKAAVRGLHSAGHAADRITIAGGATKSPLWLQMHADATGLEVVVNACSEAPLLGAACLAAVGAGHFSSVDDAVAAMVRPAKRIRPDPPLGILRCDNPVQLRARAAEYDKLFGIYEQVLPTAGKVLHQLAAS